MSDVLRFDRGEYRRAVRLDNGVLRVDAVPTRAGVFAYRNADGTTRRELRLPEEVFHSDSLATLEGAVITLGHPPTGTVTGRVRDLQRGHLGTDVSRDGHLVRASAFVTDSEAQQAAETGKARELSCGYRCDLVDERGQHPVYGAYDAKQTRIRYDHVALLPKGRAGPEARLHLDSADDAAAVMVLDEEPAADAPPTPPADGGHQQRNDSMDPKLITIRFDGVDYQIPEQAAQAVQKVQSRQDEQIASLTQERDEAKKIAETAQAKADAAEAAKAELQKRLDEASTPSATHAAVKARLELERKATEVLGQDKAKEIKLDTLDDAGIRRAVVAATLPSMRLDEQASEERLTVAYEAALAHHEQVAKQPHPGLADTRRRADAVSATADDLESRRADALEKQRKRAAEFKPSVTR